METFKETESLIFKHLKGKAGVVAGGILGCGLTVAALLGLGVVCCLLIEKMVDTWLRIRRKYLNRNKKGKEDKDVELGGDTQTKDGKDGKTENEGNPTASQATPNVEKDGNKAVGKFVPVNHTWDDVVHTCSNQRVFCNQQCVTHWLNRTGNSFGYCMNLPTLCNLAKNWYSGRLGTPYKRREPSQAAEYFKSVGLKGSFWGS